MTHQIANRKSQTLKPKSPISDESWNTALAALPAPHILQSWEWSEFKSRYGWRPSRYLWQNDDQARAAASLLTRRLSGLPAAVSYVPKGPILDYADTALLKEVLAHLETVARRERALFVKIDPDVQVDSAEGRAVVEMLCRRGWRPSREQIQFRNTMVLDLARDPEEMLAAMKSKWRYNVRLARRKGITVRQGTLADLPLLYRMYAETATRDGFVIRTEGYYHDAWGSFIEAGLARPLIATAEEEAVAMVIIFRFQKRAWYMYGASTDSHREKMPNHLLQWEAMLWARERGCTVYDMWGAPDVLDESDPMWGVYRFKQGFGGEFVEHIGAWDFPTSRIGYWLYTSVMPHALATMRWLHWHQPGSKASSA
ncbi:MAG: lipid II:glycine glycyltransferase FemX [Anaerolineae bacterium]